jgi:hypothetical protein
VRLVEDRRGEPLAFTRGRGRGDRLELAVAGPDPGRPMSRPGISSAALPSRSIGSTSDMVLSVCASDTAASCTCGDWVRACRRVAARIETVEHDLAGELHAAQRRGQGDFPEPFGSTICPRR